METTTQSLSLADRFEQAHALGKTYLEKWLRVREIQQQRTDLSLNRPKAELARVEDATQFVEKNEQYLTMYGNLGTEESELNAWMSDNNQRLMVLLDGDYRTSEYESLPSITLLIDNHRIIVGYEFKSGLYIESTKPVAPLPFDRNNIHYQAGKAMLEAARELVADQFPKEGTTTGYFPPELIVQVAHTMALAGIREQTAYIAQNVCRD